LNSSLRTVLDNLALLDLTKGGSIYENVADGEIEATIQEQMHVDQKNISIRKKMGQYCKLYRNCNDPI
jgi:hypothetical protein